MSVASPYAPTAAELRAFREAVGLSPPERWRLALDRSAAGLTVLGEDRRAVVAALEAHRAGLVSRADALRRKHARPMMTAVGRAKAAAALAEVESELAWHDARIAELEGRR